MGLGLGLAEISASVLSGISDSILSLFLVIGLVWVALSLLMVLGPLSLHMGLACYEASHTFAARAVNVTRHSCTQCHLPSLEIITH